jgi:hypothetical protein
MVSPAWTGTTVPRPSECRRKWWLPLTLATSNPAFRRADMTSLPLIRGSRSRHGYLLDADEVEGLHALALDF